MDTVYIETTVIGHLVGRLQPDGAISAKQLATRDWWMASASRFRLLISEIVCDECSAGDPIAAQERLEVIEKLELLEITDEIRELARTLTSVGAIPASEPRDALHVAIAAVHGVQYLVTWNFKHIANASMRSRIEAACRDAGFEPPTICTPEELPGDESDA